MVSAPPTAAFAGAIWLTMRPGLSEEQISDIFSSVGRVVNFRLVYDKETGKPKGYGFVEFQEAGMRHYLVDYVMPNPLL